MTNCQRLEAANIMQNDGFAAATRYIRSAILCCINRADELVNDILTNGV